MRVADEDIDALQETLLLGKYNFGAPRVAVTAMRAGGNA